MVLSLEVICIDIGEEDEEVADGVNSPKTLMVSPKERTGQKLL